jgi:hypothetical protein
VVRKKGRKFYPLVLDMDAGRIVWPSLSSPAYDPTEIGLSALTS